MCDATGSILSVCIGSCSDRGQSRSTLYKYCVLDIVQLFRDDLSLHFHNQSEVNSEDNTK